MRDNESPRHNPALLAVTGDIHQSAVEAVMGVRILRAAARGIEFLEPGKGALPQGPRELCADDTGSDAVDAAGVSPARGDDDVGAVIG